MWAPLRGFKYGPQMATLCARGTGPQVSAVAQVLLISLSQSRGRRGEGRQGLVAATQSSLTSP